MKNFEISFLLPYHSLMSKKDIREFCELFVIGIQNVDQQICFTDFLSALLISLNDENLIKTNKNQKFVLEKAKALSDEDWEKIKKHKPSTILFHFNDTKYRYENGEAYQEKYPIQALLNGDAQ